MTRKYTALSSYSYCANNPVNFTDPDGKDIYRDSCGVLVLVRVTDDGFDQIAKTNRHGEVKKDKQGNEKIKVDNIEKGILHNGIDFTNKDNAFKLGLPDGPTIAGFESFMVDYSKAIGKEIRGYYYAERGTTTLSYLYVGRTQGNEYDKSYAGKGLYEVFPELRDNFYPHTSWHTHPSASNSLEPSDDDLRIKAGDMRDRGTREFYILTPGTNGYIKKDYTKMIK